MGDCDHDWEPPKGSRSPLSPHPFSQHVRLGRDTTPRGDGRTEDDDSAKASRVRIY